MERIKIILYIIFFSCVLTIKAQDKKVSYSSNVEACYVPGEKLIYTLAYDWLLLNVDVATVDLSVNKSYIFGKECLHLKGTGITTKNWDFFYKVRDIYESWIDPVTLRPIYYKRDISEDDFKLDITYKFDWPRKLVYSKSTENDKPTRLDTIPLPNDAFDLVSILYYARNIDFSKYKKGDKIPVDVVMDRELYNLYFRYLGKEKKKVNGKVYNTIHFSALVVSGHVFKEDKESLHFWISDDKNKIPVYAKSPIRVGSVELRLDSYEGLKYPMQAIHK